MSPLKDQIKRIVKEEVLGTQTNPSKYRLGHVALLNADGTAAIVIDGKQIIAQPLYPVVKGQEVAVIFSEGGVVSAVPTKPNTGPVDVIKSEFFSGGIADFRFFCMGNDSSFAYLNHGDVLFQQTKDEKIYVLRTGLSPITDPFVFVSRLSPNGSYVSVFSFDIPASSYRVTIYKIGTDLFTAGSEIDATDRVFFLSPAPTITHQFSISAPPLFSLFSSGVSNVWINNLGFPYWLDVLSENAAPQNRKSRLLTLDTGTLLPVVLASQDFSVIAFPSFGFSNIFGALLSTFSSVYKPTPSGGNLVATILFPGPVQNPVVVESSNVAGDFAAMSVVIETNSTRSVMFFVTDGSSQVGLFSQKTSTPTPPILQANLSLPNFPGFSAFGIFAVLVTKSKGNFLLRTDISDGKARVYELTGSLSGTLTQSASAEVVSMGDPDDTIVRVFDFSSLDTTKFHLIE